MFQLSSTPANASPSAASAGTMISNNRCERRIACLWATRTASSSPATIPAASQTGLVSSNAARASRSASLHGKAATWVSSTPSVSILPAAAPAPTRAAVVALSPLMMVSNRRRVDRVSPGQNRHWCGVANADPVSSRHSGVPRAAAAATIAGHRLPDSQTAQSGLQCAMNACVAVGVSGGKGWWMHGSVNSGGAVRWFVVTRTPKSVRRSARRKTRSATTPRSAERGACSQTNCPSGRLGQWLRASLAPPGRAKSGCNRW